MNLQNYKIIELLKTHFHELNALSIVEDVKDVSPMGSKYKNVEVDCFAKKQFQ